MEDVEAAWGEALHMGLAECDFDVSVSRPASVTEAAALLLPDTSAHTGPDWRALPLPALSIVLGYLSNIEDCAVVYATCRAWRSATQRDVLTARRLQFRAESHRRAIALQAKLAAEELERHRTTMRRVRSQCISYIPFMLMPYILPAAAVALSAVGFAHFDSVRRAVSIVPACPAGDSAFAALYVCAAGYAVSAVLLTMAVTVMAVKDMPITYHYKPELCGHRLSSAYTEVFLLWGCSIGLFSNGASVGGAFAALAFAHECGPYNDALYYAMLVYAGVAGAVAVLFLVASVLGLVTMARDGNVDYCHSPCH